MKANRSTPALAVRKLDSTEDEQLHEEIARVNRADAFARDIVIAGAIPETVEPWVRVHSAIDELVNSKRPEDFDHEREEWAYYLGIAVGLRLAGGAR